MLDSRKIELIWSEIVMFIIRFFRNDNQPIEEYYYKNIDDAKYHLSLFREDDSGLYEKIDIINEDIPYISIDIIVFP